MTVPERSESPTSQGRRAPLRSAPLPLTLHDHEDFGSSDSLGRGRSGRSSSRSRAKAASLSPKGLAVNSAAHLGGYAQLTASTMMKFEHFHKQHKVLRTVTQPGKVRGLADSPEQPGKAGAGFSFWTSAQRPESTEPCLQHGPATAWYDWAESYEKSSKGNRISGACWSLDHSRRTSPQQWWKDATWGQAVRVDGPGATQRRSLSRSPTPTPQRTPSSSPRTLTPLGRQSHRFGSPVPREIRVPRPILLQEEVREAPHLQHMVTGPFTVSHPEWCRPGRPTFGRSARGISPSPKTAREDTSKHSRSPSPQLRR